MSKKTSLLLGLLSALLTFMMVLVWIFLAIVLFFPLDILIGVNDVTVMVTALIIRILIIVILVVMVIPMVVYAIATPQYFLYLEESHSRFVLKLHKVVNVILCGFFFITSMNWLKGILFDGHNTRFEFWFVLASFGLTLPLAVFVKVPKRQTKDAKALS